MCLVVVGKVRDMEVVILEDAETQKHHIGSNKIRDL